MLLIILVALMCVLEHVFHKRYPSLKGKVAVFLFVGPILLGLVAFLFRSACRMWSRLALKIDTITDANTYLGLLNGTKLGSILGFLRRADILPAIEKSPKILLLESQISSYNNLAVILLIVSVVGIILFYTGMMKLDRTKIMIGAIVVPMADCGLVLASTLCTNALRNVSSIADGFLGSLSNQLTGYGYAFVLITGLLTIVLSIKSIHAITPIVPSSVPNKPEKDSPELRLQGLSGAYARRRSQGLEQTESPRKPCGQVSADNQKCSLKS